MKYRSTCIALLCLLTTTSPAANIAPAGAGLLGSNTPSCIQDAALLKAPLYTASSEGFFSNSNPTLPVNSSAKGNVGLGKLDFKVAEYAHNGSFFSAVTSGGWEETLLINSPGQAGVAAWLLCKFKVDLHFYAEAPAGSASFRFEVRTDGVGLSSADPGYVGGSSQRPYPAFIWGHANYNPPEPLTKSVVEDIVISVPITFGHQILLRAYGVATAGFRALGPYPSMRSEAYCRLNWASIQGVINAGGQPYPNITVDSLSGTPYSLELQPKKVPAKGLVVAPQGGRYRLTWPSWLYEKFSVETSEALTNWTLQPALPAAAGQSMSFDWTPPPGQQRGFLRVFEEF